MLLLIGFCVHTIGGSWRERAGRPLPTPKAPTDQKYRVGHCCENQSATATATEARLWIWSSQCPELWRYINLLTYILSSIGWG